MRQGYLDKKAEHFKVQYLFRGINVDVAGEIGKFKIYYLVRAVFAYDKYPTKEGKDILAVFRRNDANDTAVSRRRIRRESAEGPNMKLRKGQTLYDIRESQQRNRTK